MTRNFFTTLAVCGLQIGGLITHRPNWILYPPMLALVVLALVGLVGMVRPTLVMFGNVTKTRPQVLLNVVLQVVAIVALTIGASTLFNKQTETRLVAKATAARNSVTAGDPFNEFEFTSKHFMSKTTVTDQALLEEHLPAKLQSRQRYETVAFIMSRDFLWGRTSDTVSGDGYMAAFLVVVDKASQRAAFVTPLLFAQGNYKAGLWGRVDPSILSAQ